MSPRPLWRHFLRHLIRVLLLFTVVVMPLVVAFSPPAADFMNLALTRDVCRAAASGRLEVEQPSPCRLFWMEEGQLRQAWPPSYQPHSRTGRLPFGQVQLMLAGPRYYALRLARRDGRGEIWGEAYLAHGFYFTQDSWTSVWRPLLLLLGFFCAFLASGLVLLARVQRRMEQLRVAAERLEAGQTEGELPMQREDCLELDQLLRALNSLSQNLAQRRLQLSQAQAEAELARQERNRLLAEVSHDLKTPLTSILGYAQLYADSGHPPLTGLEERGRQLLRQVQTWLEGCRLESGAVELQVEDVHLTDCLEEAVFLAGVQPQAVDLPPKSPIVRADGAVMTRLLADLLRGLECLELRLSENRLAILGQARAEVVPLLSAAQRERLLSLQGFGLTWQEGGWELAWGDRTPARLEVEPPGPSGLSLRVSVLVWSLTLTLIFAATFALVCWLDPMSMKQLAHWRAQASQAEALYRGTGTAETLLGVPWGRANLWPYLGRGRAELVGWLGWILALGSLGSWQVARQVERPLSSLVEACQAWIQARQAPPQSPSRWRDLAGLQQSFSRMLQTLRVQEEQQQELLQSTRQALALKQSLLRYSYGEFRKPLIEMQESLQGLPAHAALSKVERNLQVMLRLLDDLRQSRPQPLQLSQVRLSEVITLAREVLNHPRLQWEEGDPQITAWLDPDRARQVLLNLLSNALKYGGDGPVRVRWGPGWLEVEDSGPGIEADRLPELLQEFRQQAGPGQGSGVGLGLATCVRLMHMQGGRLELHPGPATRARMVFAESSHFSHSS